MSKRVADKLRGHARLLEGVRYSIGFDQKEAALTVLDGVIANLRRDAAEAEQRGKDWVKDPLRPYRVARERELEELGIEEQERKVMPPRQEKAL